MTNKYTFYNSSVDHHGKTSTLDMSFEAENLEEVLDRFEQFLAGCGFVLDGHLDIVSEDVKFDQEEMNSYLDELEAEQRNQERYSIDRFDNLHSEK